MEPSQIPSWLSLPTTADEATDYPILRWNATRFDDPGAYIPASARIIDVPVMVKMETDNQSYIRVLGSVARGDHTHSNATLSIVGGVQNPALILKFKLNIETPPTTLYISFNYVEHVQLHIPDAPLGTIRERTKTRAPFEEAYRKAQVFDNHGSRNLHDIMPLSSAEDHLVHAISLKLPQLGTTQRRHAFYRKGDASKLGEELSQYVDRLEHQASKITIFILDVKPQGQNLALADKICFLRDMLRLGRGDDGTFASYFYARRQQFVSGDGLSKNPYENLVAVLQRGASQEERHALLPRKQPWLLKPTGHFAFAIDQDELENTAGHFPTPDMFAHCWAQALLWDWDLQDMADLEVLLYIDWVHLQEPLRVPTLDSPLLPEFNAFLNFSLSETILGRINPRRFSPDFEEVFMLSTEHHATARDVILGTVDKILGNEDDCQRSAVQSILRGCKGAVAAIDGNSTNNRNHVIASAVAGLAVIGQKTLIISNTDPALDDICLEIMDAVEPYYLADKISKSILRLYDRATEAVLERKEAEMYYEKWGHGREYWPGSIDPDALFPQFQERDDDRQNVENTDLEMNPSLEDKSLAAHIHRYAMGEAENTFRQAYLLGLSQLAIGFPGTATKERYRDAKMEYARRVINWEGHAQIIATTTTTARKLHSKYWLEKVDVIVIDNAHAFNILHVLPILALIKARLVILVGDSSKAPSRPLRANEVNPYGNLLEMSLLRQWGTYNAERILKFHLP